ncbi:hypothetical protein CDIK_2814 [Cucumispora dikerogammari]|nr:hypothetical protein CDIK_2814 [Cucumispora dikerogammari]
MFDLIIKSIYAYKKHHLPCGIHTKYRVTKKRVHKTILSINNDFCAMDREFEQRFSTIIQNYKDMQLYMEQCDNARFRRYTPVTCILQRYMLYNFSVDLFFNQLISFYDEFSSKINKKIEYVSKGILNDICFLIRYINKFQDRKANEVIIDIDTIEKCKYLSFYHFIKCLAKMSNKTLELKTMYLNKILYLDTTVASWRKRTLRRVFFLDVDKPISSRPQGDQETIARFKEMVTLDIMKEYHYAANPKHDSRFSLLKPMLKKYKSYDKVPGDIQSNFSRCLFFKKKTYTKTKIETRYFKYISYNSKRWNEFEKKFDNIISRYSVFLESHNLRVLTHRQ